jgi:hypothetical protein
VFFDGKHTNIKDMDALYLPIPDTCILGVGFKNADFEKWLEDHSQKDILIRTSMSQQQRGSYSVRDSSKSDFSYENLKNIVGIDCAVILQALPLRSIDHDCMSGICQFSSDNNPYFKNWEIVAHPDIASLSNRLNLSPWWDVKLNGIEVKGVNENTGNREVLLNSIYYRVGRSLLKKKGLKVNKLEKVEYKSTEWNKVIQYCKNNLDELPADHALILLENRIVEKGLDSVNAQDIVKRKYLEIRNSPKGRTFLCDPKFDRNIFKKGLEDLQPDTEDIEILRKMFPRFRKLAKYLNGFPQTGYPFSFGVKFSILEYKDKEKIPICWDIIRGT